MKTGPLVLAVAAVLAFGAAFSQADAQFQSSGATPTLLESRGMPMSQQEAFERIAFRPVIPIANYLEVALLPPFHGTDRETPQNRGIGYEYEQDGVSWVLLEWPRAGGSLERYPTLPNGTQACPDTRVILGRVERPRALAWETTTLVFALQPDGSASPRELRAEWLRLVRRGACR